MKRLIKQLTALVLAAAMLLGPALPAFAESAEGEYDGWIIYSAEEGEDFNPENMQVVQTPLLFSASMGSGTFYMEPNYRLYTQEVSYCTESAVTWNHKLMDTNFAWNHQDSQGNFDMRGDGVLVAVIDEGVDASHPDFIREDGSSTVIATASAIKYGGKTYDFSSYDGNHGTEVASVIAAQLNGSEGPESEFNVDGVAPDVTILSLCVARGGSINIDSVVAAIHYAVDQGADVINMSLGSENIKSSTFEAACNYADEHGVIVVASAGNRQSGSASSSRSMAPASYSSVVSVSACKETESGAVFDGSYSFYNNTVDVCAPGTSIQVLKPQSKYAVDSGTSMASPAVAAMAAILKQANKASTRLDFLELLEVSSDLESHKTESEYQYKYGCGVVNIENFCRAIYPSIRFFTGDTEAAFASGTTVPAIYAYFDGIQSLPEPVNTSSAFISWYSDPAFSGEPVTGVEAGIKGDVSLYARFEAIADQPFTVITGSAIATGGGIQLSIQAQDSVPNNSYELYISLYDQYGRWLGMEKKTIILDNTGSVVFNLTMDGKEDATDVSFYFLSTRLTPRQKPLSCSITDQDQ